jgi:cell division inhibitor SulA/protein ImuA
MGSAGGSVGKGAALSSGFKSLDHALQGGGWQRPGLTEILCNHTGIGELSLLMRGLHADKSRFDEASHVLWVLSQGQSWIPYAPALAQAGIHLDQFAIVRARSTEDAFWAAEQGLKSGACRAVLLRISDARCNPLSLRRLLQSAISGNSLVLLMRPLEAAISPSPAGTRIALHPDEAGGLRVEILKQRGLPPGKTLHFTTRSLACLQRDPQPSIKQNSTRPARWLDGLIAGIDAAQSKIRERSLERDRR